MDKKSSYKALLTGIVIAVTALGSHYLVPQISFDAPLALFERNVSIEARVFGVVEGARITPTDIHFNSENNIEVISDFSNSRFIFRDLNQSQNQDAWETSKGLELNKPHAITFHPTTSLYFAVDTSNHQIISFPSFSATKGSVQTYKQIGAHPVGKRPHDIEYNYIDRYIYALLHRGIVRFRAKSEGIDDIEFVSMADIQKQIDINFPESSFKTGYMRSFSIADGMIFLVNSTQGNVVQLTDFQDPNTWIAHINSNQPHKYSEKGSFDQNGLILNAVDYYNGYWYGTNYYVGNKHRYLSEASVSKNKLIRWRSWEDFENSQWEDLSHLVHPLSIPYYFTQHDGRLFISMFHGDQATQEGSGVYEIKTSMF